MGPAIILTVNVRAMIKEKRVVNLLFIMISIIQVEAECKTNFNSEIAQCVSIAIIHSDCQYELDTTTNSYHSWKA